MPSGLHSPITTFDKKIQRHHQHFCALGTCFAKTHCHRAKSHIKTIVIVEKGNPTRAQTVITDYQREKGITIHTDSSPKQVTEDNPCFSR